MAEYYTNLLVIRFFPFFVGLVQSMDNLKFDVEGNKQFTIQSTLLKQS